MNKKGSMELSVNSIVILVIAIVMLGLILGFVRSKFADISGDLDSNEPIAAAASYADPITMSRDQIRTNPGDTETVRVNLYNRGSSAMTVDFTIDCDPPGTVDTTRYSTTKSIEAGSYSEVLLGMNIATNAQQGTAICSLTSTLTQDNNGIQYYKDFTITIN